MANLINPRPGIQETYDFLDTSSGIGYKRYFPFLVVSGVTLAPPNQYPIPYQCKITDKEVGSARTMAEISFSTIDTTTPVPVYQVDADIPYTFQTDTPRVLQGDAYVSLTQGVYNQSAQGAALFKSEVEFYRVRSGVPTALCSGSSITWGNTAYADYPLSIAPSKEGSHNLCIKATFPKTQIKKNDSLRVRFRMLCADPGYGSRVQWIGFGTDPRGRYNGESDMPKILLASGSTLTTVDLPFKIIQ